MIGVLVRKDPAIHSLAFVVPMSLFIAGVLAWSASRVTLSADVTGDSMAGFFIIPMVFPSKNLL